MYQIAFILSGGLGLGVLEECIIIDELAYGCTGIQVAMTGNGLAVSVIVVVILKTIQWKFVLHVYIFYLFIFVDY